MLGVLKLAPAVIEAISALGDPLPQPLVSERKLRHLAKLDEAQQWNALAKLMGSKDDYIGTAGNADHNEVQLQRGVSLK